MEESARVYGTFYACYTFFKRKNTYSEFLSIFLENSYPKLTLVLFS